MSVKEEQSKNPPEKILVLEQSARERLQQIVKQEYPEFKPGQEDSKLVLRLGVRSGGCSGMSYVMETAKEADAIPDVSEMSENYWNSRKNKY